MKRNKKKIRKQLIHNYYKKEEDKIKNFKINTNTPIYNLFDADTDFSITIETLRKFSEISNQKIEF